MKQLNIQKTFLLKKRKSHPPPHSPNESWSALGRVSTIQVFADQTLFREMSQDINIQIHGLVTTQIEH